MSPEPPSTKWVLTGAISILCELSLYVSLHLHLCSSIPKQLNYKKKKTKQNIRCRTYKVLLYHNRSVRNRFILTERCSRSFNQVAEEFVFTSNLLEKTELNISVTPKTSVLRKSVNLNALSTVNN